MSFTYLQWWNLQRALAVSVRFPGIRSDILGYCIIMGKIQLPAMNTETCALHAKWWWNCAESLQGWRSIVPENSMWQLGYCRRMSIAQGVFHHSKLSIDCINHGVLCQLYDVSSDKVWDFLGCRSCIWSKLEPHVWACCHTTETNMEAKNGWFVKDFTVCNLF